MRRILRSPVLMAVASLLLTGGLAQAGGSAPGACASIKAKATGTQIAGSMACQASAIRKGVFVSFTCLASAQTKLARAFAKADKKGSCGMPDDATIVGDSVSAFAEGMAGGLFPVDTGDTARRCASTKMRRAGAYGRGRLGCWATSFRDDAVVDPACEEAVVTRLAAGFLKSEAKGGCATTGDRPDIQQAVDGFADAVAGFLTPPPTTPTTTVISGSTTTTTSTIPSGSTTTSTVASGSTTTTVVGATTTTSTVPSVVRLSLHVQPILTARCATAGCHAGAHPAQDMDLRAGYAFGNLVNVASAECPLFKRVLPGKPAQSYLVFKITGPPQPCFSGNQMPSGGAAPLSAADQNLIATWIGQGAVNN